MLKIVGSAIIVLLILFLVFNGLPKPGNIVWQSQDWAYAGQDDGVMKFTSETGISLTLQAQEPGSYIVYFQDQEYKFAVGRQQVSIIFPDGLEQRGGILGPDSAKEIIEIDNPISSDDLPMFYLAMEVDRVIRPHTPRLIIGILIMIYGVISILNPQRFAQYTLYFRRWMGANRKPTEFNIRATRNMGGFFVVAGWLIVLMSIWKVF